MAFSNIVNGIGIKFEDGKPVEVTSPYNFIYCYVELKQDLNFKSKMSYADSQRTDFGDINGITDDSNTLINEMTTGAGFHPIGDIVANVGFAGSFEGNNKKIQEIYVNCENFAGLFGKATRLKSIKNLEISGNITVKEGSGGSTAGGILAQVTTEIEDTMIENCINNANVNGIEATGGIVGYKRPSGKRLIISNCKNNGKKEKMDI